MVWIRTIPWDESDGELRTAYDWQAARLGAPAEFTMLGSLYPPIVEERLRLYRAVEGCPSALAPEERILAAFVTSLLNGTAHCASGLRHRLLGLGWTEHQVDAVAADPTEVRTGAASARRDRRPRRRAHHPSPIRSPRTTWTACAASASATSSCSTSTTSSPTTTTSTGWPTASV